MGSAGINGLNDAALYRNGEWTLLTDLVDPSFNLRTWQAWDINDAGQIAVIGWDPTALGYSTYILTPIPEAKTQPLESRSKVESMNRYYAHAGQHAGPI